MREAGVGAESPPPSPKHEIAISEKKLEDEKNLKEEGKGKSRLEYET